MSYIAVPCGGGQRPQGVWPACLPMRLPACCLPAASAHRAPVSCRVMSGRGRSCLLADGLTCVRVRACAYTYIYRPASSIFWKRFFDLIFGSDFWPKFYRHSTAPPEKPLFIGIFLIPHGLKSDFWPFFGLLCCAPSAALLLAISRHRPQI